MTTKDNKKESSDELDLEDISSRVVDNAWSLKIPKFEKGDMKHPLLEETKFQALFPKYREKYLQECWPLMQKKMDELGIKAELDLIGGTMCVATTRNTWDPSSILKARGVMQLLQRSVPFEHAVRVLDDGVTHEILKIDGYVTNKERFAKRRQRLVGSKGTVLKALELLTDCYILIQGNTVSAIGPYTGVTQVMEVVKKTMKNIHPVYLLKCLMIKRELAKNEKLKHENWSRFLPEIVHRPATKIKPKKKKKQPYTPFPPEPTESKVDKLLAEGKYFVDKEEKGKGKKRTYEGEQKYAPGARRDEKRMKPYIPPVEDKFTGSKNATEKGDVDVNALKKKVKKSKK